jgi:hypothetical protein
MNAREYARDKIIVYTGGQWFQCGLCRQGAAVPDAIRHGDTCPLKSLESEAVKVVAFGPWIYAEGRSFLELDGEVGFDVYDEVGIDGKIYVVGDINKSGGECDCCSVNYDKVTKYRKAARTQEVIADLSWSE